MKSKLLGSICALIATSAWGSLYVVSKVVLDTVPPFTLLLFRYLVAAAALLILLKTRKPERIERKDYKFLFFIGFVGYFLSVGAQFVGTKMSGASLASLINSMNPVFIIIFAVLFLKEKLTAGKSISLIASLAGTYIIVGRAGNNGVMLEGIIVSVFAVVAWSAMSVVVKQIADKYDAITITTYAILVALFCTLPVSIWELTTTPNLVLLQPKVIWSVLYMGLISTAVAHVCWNKSLALMEAGICSLFYPVQPMVSVLLGALFLGEKMNASFFVGAVLIIGGVLVSVVAEQKN